MCSMGTSGWQTQCLQRVKASLPPLARTKANTKLDFQDSRTEEKEDVKAVGKVDTYHIVGNPSALHSTVVEPIHVTARAAEIQRRLRGGGRHLRRHVRH